MSFLLKKILIRLTIIWFICLFTGERSYFAIAEKPYRECNQKDKSENGNINGYRDIIFCNGKFLAAGANGRIDYINNSGEKTP